MVQKEELDLEISAFKPNVTNLTSTQTKIANNEALKQTFLSFETSGGENCKNQLVIIEESKESYNAVIHKSTLYFGIIY